MPTKQQNIAQLNQQAPQPIILKSFTSGTTFHLKQPKHNDKSPLHERQSSHEIRAWFFLEISPAIPTWKEILDTRRVIRCKHENILLAKRREQDKQSRQGKQPTPI